MKRTTITICSLPSLALLLLLVSLLVCVDAGGGWIEVDSRHQRSLSTFDTRGKLLQVDYAMEAASMGTPVVAVGRPGVGIFLAAPQVLPSPLVLQDGTARFARVTPHLLVAHSGLSADGRVVVAAAQELAIQHEYVYDEDISVDLFLQEMALLYQDHTMQAGVRPFGTTLVVAHLVEEDGSCCCFYRIDPSGAVESLGNYAVINGGKLQSDQTLWHQLQEISNPAETTTTTTLQELGDQVVHVLQDALIRSSSEGGKESKKELPSNIRRILTASLTSEEGMVLDGQEVLPPRQQQKEEVE